MAGSAEATQFRTPLGSSMMHGGGEEVSSAPTNDSEGLGRKLSATPSEQQRKGSCKRSPRSWLDFQSQETAFTGEGLQLTGEDSKLLVLSWVPLWTAQHCPPQRRVYLQSRYMVKLRGFPDNSPVSWILHTQPLRGRTCPWPSTQQEAHHDLRMWHGLGGGGRAIPSRCRGSPRLSLSVFPQRENSERSIVITHV